MTEGLNLHNNDPAGLPPLNPEDNTSTQGAPGNTDGTSEAATAPISSLLTDLGINPVAGSMDVPATTAFKKEGVIEVTPDYFRIINLDNGSRILLKGVQGYGSRSADPANPDLEKIETVERMQREVLASRIAQAVGYPMPETSLVQQDGRPWIAYRFLEQAREYSPGFTGLTREHSVQFHGVLRNPEMVAVRPFLNALIDAREDSALQGLVDVQPDGTGIYYASDMMTSIGPAQPELSDEELHEVISSRLQEDSVYGKLPIHAANRTPEDVAQFASGVRALRSGLARLTPEVAEEIFRDKIGSIEDRRIMANRLLQRAKVLLAYMPKVPDEVVGSPVAG